MFARNIDGPPFSFRLRNEMDRVFSGLLGTEMPFTGGNAGAPALNIWDEGEVLVVEAELPGLRMEDIEVLVCNDELTIKGERWATGSEDATFHRRERSIGKFSRVVRLPVAINSNAVEASLKNGVLTIRLPKAQEVLPRKVTVTG